MERIKITVPYLNKKEDFQERCYYCDKELSPYDPVAFYYGEKETTYVCLECFEKDLKLFEGEKEDD